MGERLGEVFQGLAAGDGLLGVHAEAVGMEPQFSMGW